MLNQKESSSKEFSLRVATWNIHKGVRGVGLLRRLEIHDIGHAIEQFDADLVFLQEVRKVHRRESLRFTRWPEQPQAEFLAPEGYESVYRTNAFTKHGEHGNALLSRWRVLWHQHQDISDHRFEQRGLLHVVLDVNDEVVHAIVVHLGLIPASRVRQLAQLRIYIERHVPSEAKLVIAGDFNEWSSHLSQLLEQDNLQAVSSAIHPTFPSRLPLAQLDHIYVRGFKPVDVHVPRGRVWQKMSDHLPLLAEYHFL